MAMKAILFFKKEKLGVSINAAAFMTQSQASLVLMSKENMH